MNRAWAIVAIAGAAGCLKVPAIVVVDRGTALEQQASGSFEDVEHRLSRSAVAPHPVTLTPEQVAALGLQAPTAGQAHLTDADAVDALLVRHCIGEGADGLLAETTETCRGVPDVEETIRAVDEVNRARRQVWRFMQSSRPDVPAEELRRAWRQRHLLGVVCGGWIQAEDGSWGAKPC